ncbi:MAG TPA: hypothetical protein VF389_07025, partial [Woeseiaceae bacterium]
MSAARLFFRPWYWLAGTVFGTWARPTVQPTDPAELLARCNGPVCYVLETGGLADTLALERVCKRYGLPSPSATLNFVNVREPSLVVLRRLQGFVLRRKRAQHSLRLRRLVEASIEAGGQELQLVPVAIYWGRSPEKEKSWFKLLFLENWEVVGRTRKLLSTMLHGRNTLLRFSEPLAISAIIQDGVEPELAFRKVSRILRVHFRQRRIASVGPDLSHRRTLVNHVLEDPSVRRVIAAEAGDSRVLLERTHQKARKYAKEVAAHISYPTIRVIDRFLGWLWNRIYDGIVLNHVERLHEVAKDSEIVYVPCHR